MLVNFTWKFVCPEFGFTHEKEADVGVVLVVTNPVGGAQVPPQLLTVTGTAVAVFVQPLAFVTVTL